MIEEAREVEKEDTTNAIGGNTVPSFKTKEGGSVGSREEFLGAELTWAQEIVAEVEGRELGGDDFLEYLAMTFEEGDGAISFSKGVVRFLRFRDDHDFCFSPGVKMKA